MGWTTLMNKNGEWFTECHVIIGCSIFPHRAIHKVTWISPDWESDILYNNCKETEDISDECESKKRGMRCLRPPSTGGLQGEIWNPP